MSETADRTDPDLWERVKAEVTKGGKGGEPGQWSARKAQLAVSKYKKAGGGYRGDKVDDNALSQWTQEDWGTRSGEPSGQTHERYLPKAAREHLSKDEYDRTTAKKRADTKTGKQFSAQPRDVAQKSARYRDGGSDRTKAELAAEARRKGVPGRSTMSKAELAKALGG